MVNVRVIYSRASLPESLVVKGKTVSQHDLWIMLDRLIEGARKDAGMDWYASGTEMVTDELIRDIAFDCDLKKILNAPTEQEINAEFAKHDITERDVVIVS